ncbi:hypothetical protein TL16_g09508 [Triparma laevis f. inornata]|uniref:non-specific serine/threonine protein kinase n=2 Tax=Triparma laevis TaxID=1534972 RepID=A0A9W7CBQ7_9STRA|nr:hypothetical protein TL16_g09508 [Triparma laevis f. inornata]GMI02805.1 hypothetical protein TrLO_g14423 [Triparma laevis f. longispina]
MGGGATKINKDAIDITHFELERIIGQGGFGKVYACRKKSDMGKLNDKESWYAIKKLEKDFILKSKTGVESVFTELSSVRDLIHQNICNCHYGFLSDDAVYIVLDIAFGGDLRYALKQSKIKEKSTKLKVFDEYRAKFYLIQVLDALDYCHSKNILHRDIKPENMLIVTNGYLKLTDFGISLKCDNIEECKARSGTMGYMAPEIIKSGSSHGTPSEWFSFGVCAHEFLLGLRPFDAKKLALCRGGIDDDLRNDMKLKELENAKDLSAEGKEFIQKLVELSIEDRLGTTGGSKTIREHPWLKDFDFAGIIAQSIKAPFMPDVTVANCDTGSNDAEEMFGGMEDEVKVSFTPEQQAKFNGYGYNMETA